MAAQITDKLWYGLFVLFDTVLVCPIAQELHQLP